LNVTVLVPCDAPKFVPVIVTEVPTTPEAGDRLAIAGGTLKLTPLLDNPPTITTTFPVVAPAGTGTTICVALQFVGVAITPLNVTVLVPGVAPKFEPAIVTDVPTAPEVGARLEIAGETAKLTPLLDLPLTATTIFPLDAPLGTGTTICVLLQSVAAANVPLKLTVLVPCVAPKFAPVIDTDVPGAPAVGLAEMIHGIPTPKADDAAQTLDLPLFSATT
jgi:hypothetical protein